MRLTLWMSWSDSTVTGLCGYFLLFVGIANTRWNLSQENHISVEE